MGKSTAKDVLSAVNKKTGKPVTEGAVKKLAGTVTPATIKSEAELRRLIKQVSSMANVPVTEATVNEIVNAVQKSGMNGAAMESMLQMMLKK